MEIKHLRAFRVKFIPVTEKKGARIGIKDLRHNKNKIISFNYETDTKREAINYLKKIGINILFSAEEEKYYYLLTEDFRTELK